MTAFRWSALALVTLVAPLLIAGAALAADGSTILDFTPILSMAIEVLTPVIAALVSWLVYRLLALIGLRVDAERREVVDQVLARAVAYGLEQTRYMKGQMNLSVDVKREAIAFGAQYAMDSAPQALAHFGITPKRLAEMIEARLPQ